MPHCINVYGLVHLYNLRRFLIVLDGLVFPLPGGSIHKNASSLLAGITGICIFRYGLAQFFIFMITSPIEFLQFLKDLVDDLGRPRFVVIAFVYKQFLEFGFYVFDDPLGVV
jgi:hypothetical protein